MNIGAVYERQGRYEEALVQYQQALAVFLAVHGQEHHSWPTVATTWRACTLPETARCAVTCC